MLKQLISDSKTKFEVAPRRGFSLEDGRTSQDGGYLSEVAVIPQMTASIDGLVMGFFFEAWDHQPCEGLAVFHFSNAPICPSFKAVPLTMNSSGAGQAVVPGAGPIPSCQASLQVDWQSE